MATKRNRNGKWEFTVKRSGLLPKPIYLTFDDEAEGDVYVRRLEMLLDRGVVPEEFAVAVNAKHPRLRALIVDYRQTQALSAADTDYLAVLLDRLPPKLELRQLTFDWVSSWVTSLKRIDNLAPSTIRHHVGSLARCLDWAVAKGALPVNPLRQLPRGYAEYTAEDGRVVARQRDGGAIKMTTERDRRLAPEEEVRIRALLGGEKPQGRQRAFALQEEDALRVMFDLALESAMRLSEMYTLTIDQLDFAKRTIFLNKTKNGNKRQVPMTTVSERLLQAHVGMRTHGQLFPWWSGERTVEEMKRCTSMLSGQFARLFAGAGCADLRFHDLRHEATSRFFERTTLTDLQIAKITGHSDPRQLARYANLRGSDLAARLW